MNAQVDQSVPRPLEATPRIKRVLLFEPGTTGHRTTILRYVIKVLLEYNIEPIIRTVEPRNNHFRLLPWLCREAVQERAELVHVLTFDGLLPQFLPGSLVWGRHVPIVATHYQYSNLKHGLRRFLLRYLLKSGAVCRFLISDPALDEYPVDLRANISFLPDPWDPNEFPRLQIDQARDLLKISNTPVVFLVFGDLSERKGLVTILRAFAAASEGRNAELLLAGVPSAECLVQLRSLPPHIRSRIREHFRFIAEEEVSAFFFATNFVLTSYPLWFTISSGTFTRACAAGKPLLAASHGVVGQAIRQYDIGLTHEAGNVDRLTSNIRQAIDAVNTQRYNKWSDQALHLSVERTLAVYGNALIRAYYLAIHKTAIS